MSDKTLQVMRAIIASRTDIEDIAQDGAEYYFKYRGHAFSIVKKRGDGGYQFWVYPSWSAASSGLIDVFNAGGDDEIRSAIYDSNDFNEDVFRELHSVVRDRHLNIDELFDDVLRES